MKLVVVKNATGRCDFIELTTAYTEIQMCIIRIPVSKATLLLSPVITCNVLLAVAIILVSECQFSSPRIRFQYHGDLMQFSTLKFHITSENPSAEVAPTNRESCYLFSVSNSGLLFLRDFPP